MVKTLKYKSSPRPARRLPVVSLQRWQAACEAVGVFGDAQVYRQLISAYSGRGRHYHSVVHVEACLRELEWARADITEPAMVELALWFHDAVYRTYRRDNEERSAQWARDAMVKLGATQETAERIAAYVRATRHAQPGLTGDAAFVVDIDLSILGEAVEVYDQYEEQIRREYWWVGRKRYARNRIRILESLLARESIYTTTPFRERCEGRARTNLSRAIRQLKSWL
jgi:predicted metal-dependent HD superfamily phosphohydrolase